MGILDFALLRYLDWILQSKFDYILVHSLNYSQISRTQSITNLDFIIFRNMTRFFIKHLYILSIYKGSGMKACI